MKNAAWLLLSIFVLFSSVFGPSAFARMNGALPDDLEENLFSYGYFQDRENDFGLKRVVENLTGLLSEPGDPKYKVIISKNPTMNAFNWQERSDEAHIVVNIGLIQNVQNFDELAILDAHELSHSKAYGKRNRGFNSQMEEIETADRGAMERVLRAGFDPRALPSLLLRISKNSGLNGIMGILGTHPNMEARITAANVWLREHFSKQRFADPRPVPWDKYAVAQFKAEKREKEKREQKEIVNPLHELDRLSEAAFQSPAFQNLSPYLRLVLFLGGFGQYPPEYYTHLVRLIDHNVPLDRNTIDTLLNVKLENVYDMTRKGVRPIFDFQDKPTNLFQFLVRLAKDLESQNLTEGQFQLLDQLYYAITLDPYVRFPMAPKDANVTNIRRTVNRIDWALPFERSVITTAYPDLKGPVSDPTPLSKMRTSFSYYKYYKYLEIVDHSDDLDIIARSLVLAGNIGFRNYEAPEYKGDIAERQKEKVKRAFEYALRTDSFSVDNLHKIRQFGNSETMKRLHLEAMVGSTLTPKRKMDLWIHHHETWRDKEGRMLEGLASSFPSLADLMNSDALSFYDQRGFDSNLQNGVWNVLEHRAGKWSLSWDLLGKMVESDQIWIRSTSSVISDLFYAELAKRYSGPAYDYNLKHAEKLQMWMETAMHRSGELPTIENLSRSTIATWLRFWEQLTRRAVTSYTDKLALRIFSHENMERFPFIIEHIPIALSSNKIWDFALRKDLLLQIRRAEWTKLKSSSGQRASAIQEELHILNKAFPESTFERQQILEEFANHIRADIHETAKIEQQKADRDTNMDGAGLRVFSGFYEHVFAESSAEGRSKDRNENTFAAMQFLLGYEEVPKWLEGQLNIIGVDRFRRTFQTLSPEIRALVLAPLLERPRGLLTSKTWEEKVIDLILKGVTAHQEESRLFLKAMIHSLEVEAPFEKPLVLSFMLSMRVNTGGKAIPIGVVVRQCLEAMGNSGVSLGQKIRQRELAPKEILDHLDDLQDRTRVPTRFAIFEMIRKRIPNAEAMLKRGDLKLLDIVGAASSKVVLTTEYKNGEHDLFEEEILKLLRDHFDRTTEVEIKKLRSMLSYLEKHGSERYRRFRSVIDLIERNLVLQNDLRNEAKKFDEVKQLYETPDADSEFQFVVIEPNAKRGVQKTYSHERLANGQSLKSLDPKDQARVYRAIFKKDSKILLGNLGADGVIKFEADRHRGNYIVDLANKTIYVIDYALLSEISGQERLAVVEILGYLYLHLSYRSSLDGVLPRWIPSIITSRLGTGLRDTIKAREEAFARFGSIFDNINEENWTAFWKKAQPILGRQESIDQEGVFASFQELIAVGEEAGLKLRPQVNDFIFALGHLEFYSKFVDKVDGQNQLSLMIRNHMVGRIKDAVFQGRPETAKERARAAAKLTLAKPQKNECNQILEAPAPRR